MSDRKAEFIRLFKQTGWSQAELARKMELTRGGVNAIITGEAMPSETSLRLLKLIIATDDSLPAVPPLQLVDKASEFFSPEEIELIHALRLLPEEDRREHLKIFRRMLAAVPQKATTYKKPKRL